MLVLHPHPERIQKRGIFLCGHLSDSDAGKNMALQWLDWSPPAHEQLRRGQRGALEAFSGAYKQFPLGFGAEFMYILMCLGA